MPPQTSPETPRTVSADDFHNRPMTGVGLKPLADPLPAGPFDAMSFLDDPDLDDRRPSLLNGYYAVKPMVPRAVQLALRRLYARRQARRRFPAWPIETRCVDQLKAASGRSSRPRGPSGSRS